MVITRTISAPQTQAGWYSKNPTIAIWAKRRGGGERLSPNTQIGKTRAHRIAAANTAHAVSGVLINMGMLMMVCTVAA
ncbi:hypothetical protein, partial [Anaplasma marginale]|uniref:hypothetical protein n=1 Tax=Anaplasma marginale TaxID=770 RepID=UPI00384DF4A5